MKQKPKCTLFKNKNHIEYRQKSYMYISFVLGLITDAKESKCLVEYRFNIPKPDRCKL